MLQEDDLGGGIIGEDVLDKGADQLWLHPGKLLVDFEVEDEDEPAVLGDVGVVEAVAGHLVLEDARGHHQVPVLEVAGCQIRLQVSPRVLVELLQLGEHDRLLHRFRDEDAFLHELGPLHGAVRLPLGLGYSGLGVACWPVFTGKHVIVVGIQVITHVLIGILGSILLVLG
jgi:hypothetical protein